MRRECKVIIIIIFLSLCECMYVTDDVVKAATAKIKDR